MLGALIGAGTSLVSGLLGSKAQKNANKAQMQMAERNIALQKEFATKGIQWKVKDAQKAGVHPLYALGANTVSFSPVSVGSTPETGLAEGIANMGQGIARAQETGFSTEGRIQNKILALQVQRGELENQKLASEIALMNQAGQPPSITGNPIIDGQSAPNQVKVNPAEVTSSRAPGIEAGSGNDAATIRTQNGYAVVPSLDVKQRIEDVTPLEWQWMVRNGLNPAPPPRNPPPGTAWGYNVFTGEWLPTRTMRQYTPYSRRSWAK